MKNRLKNLDVVLVRAENPVNIGQSARAMKNFGVSRLSLVACAPHKVEAAFTPGWKARTVLKKASCFSSLPKAILQTDFSVGFTARTGKYRSARPWPEKIQEILSRLKQQRVALVYGNEKNGLSNAELDQCHTVVTLPAHPGYTSLNLSHAVVTSLAMLYAASLKERTLPPEKPADFHPKAGELEMFFKDLEVLLGKLGYEDKGKNLLLTRVLENFKIYFRRAGLDRRELHLFHSLTARACQRLKQ